MKKIFFLLVGMFLCVLGTNRVSLAKPVVTSITAEVVSISGNQLPISIGVNDTVTFRYEYDDEGTEAHNYYISGLIETIPLSFYPHLSALSDAYVTYSDNLLETFSEFHGNNGYALNSNWVYTEGDNRIFHSWLFPSTSIYMGYSLLEGLTPHTEGSILLWSSDYTVTTVLLDFTETRTVTLSLIQLPDTGQTKCYQSVSPYDEIPCAGTGQDGAYSINPMSFTDNGDGTVTDNNTGLIWQQEDDGLTYNWYQASGTYDATYNPTSQNVCGSLSLGGHSDWRLPAKKELMAIVDYGIPYPGPTIDTTYFPNTKSSFYWSSTAVAGVPDYAWDVHFYSGMINYSIKYNSYYVRCVRGRQSPSQNLTDNGNGTVTDNRTGLMWQKGEPGYMAWGSALSYCEGLSLGGASDWRLPNVKEIESLTNDERYNPAIDTNFFQNSYGYYWSSTTNAYYPYYTWVGNFSYGSIGNGNKYDSFYARCVRTAQSGLIDLPRTGQTKCYDSAGTEIACAGTGQDGEIQAGVAWPNPRFADNLDGTVTDNLTGLMWTQDGGTPTVGSCTGGGMNWQQALDYVACLNNNNYLDHNDWRLPNLNEFESLNNSGEPDTAAWLNAEGFSSVQSNLYWSSTSLAINTSLAWVVAMWGGGAGYEYKDANYLYVWPVRVGQSGIPDSSYPANIWKTGQTVSYAAGDDGDMVRGVAWPAPRFSDNGNGTVTDNLTGLIWTKDTNAPGPSVCTQGTQKTWQGALDYVACLNANSYLGYNDWRLPNWEELRSLIDYSNYAPALPIGHPFTSVQSFSYWSSSSGAYVTNFAWDVFMWSGVVFSGSKDSSYSYVWPVRGGVVTCIPTGPDTNCNGLDEDCDGIPDDGYVPTPTNCGAGVCASTGQLICQNGATVNTCQPGTPQTEGPNGSPTCSDGLDNDCDGATDSADSNCIVSVVTVISPNGGPLPIESGSIYTINWSAPSQAVKFDVYYSMNNGTAWKLIASKITGTSRNWTVPCPINNKKNSLVRVVGFNASSVKIGEDRSDSTFTIEVVKLLSPNGGEILKPGDPWLIRWDPNCTIRPVAKTKLFKSLNGGSTWTLIKTLIGNPGSYSWNAPSVSSTNCKVKVVFKDVNLVTVGSDISDGVFTIQP